MNRSAEAQARETKIAELKELITTRRYESLEGLEDAVDTCLWSEHDRRQIEEPSVEMLVHRPLE